MYEGVLNVYKERGFTSHDVVAKLRGILKMKKIGHTGTLDPDAEGVLPVCLGQATRLCDMLTDEGKTYRAVMLLGVETDTQDIGGCVLRKRTVAPALQETPAYDAGKPADAAASLVPEKPEDGPDDAGTEVDSQELTDAGTEVDSQELTDAGTAVDSQELTDVGAEVDSQELTDAGTVVITEKQAAEAVLSFVGRYDQVPPMYSALKVNGRKLYELARQGRTVERQARPVVIHRIDIESVDLPRVTMTVQCSKGTYIRTLCHDIGQKLGCGACMESLLRVRVGRFGVGDSLHLAQIEQLRDEGGLEARIVPVEEMFSGYPKASAEPEADRMARNGNPLGLGQVHFADGKPSGNSAGAGTEPGAESDAGAGTEPGAGTELGAESGAGTDPEPGTEPGAGNGPASGPENTGKYRLYDSGGRFLGIYVYEPEKNRLKPWKLFLSESAG